MLPSTSCASARARVAGLPRRATPPSRPLQAATTGVVEGAGQAQVAADAATADEGGGEVAAAVAAVTTGIMTAVVQARGGGGAATAGPAEPRAGECSHRDCHVAAYY